MVFSSLIFLYAFFSLSLGAYALCRSRKAQNVVLLLFSLVFYAWGEPKYVFLLMFMAFTSWLCALGVEHNEDIGRRRLWVAAAAVIDIGLIGFFKYAGLACSIFGPVPEFVKNIALPIGISFYTFQLLTYVVDVYRRDAEAQKNYWNVLLYACLFHQCIAGPIVRYKSIADELFAPAPRQSEWAGGVSRFCAGLAKKVLLANPCGAIADTLILTESAASDVALLLTNAEALSSVSVLGAWVGVIAYSLQLYLDFSAYSDMAIGMGRMLGLHYAENFNYPYIARSVTEFWHRWHISLGTFFRDYVYFPLGGSRRGIPRMVFNCFVVWSLTGLWHGAAWNYLLWGLWFYVFLMLERFVLKVKLLNKLPGLSNFYLLFVVLLGRVIFRFTEPELIMTLFRSLFGLNGNPLTSFTDILELQNNLFLLIVACLGSTPIFKLLKEKIEERVDADQALERAWNIGFYSILPLALLLLSTACLVGDSYNPFIYFQF